MIRINLLPRATKQGGASANNQVWFAAYAGAAMVLCSLLAFLYLSLDSELGELKQQNAVIEKQIASVKNKVGNLDDVKAELDRSRQLEEVVQELLDARSGPARLLMELSNILTPGEGPTVAPERLAELRRDNPTAGFAVGWDAQRLWLDSFSEQGGKCEIHGVGRNNEDVAEFLRRLEVSELFEGVRLDSTRAGSTDATDTIAFNLHCKVNY